MTADWTEEAYPPSTNRGRRGAGSRPGSRRRVSPIPTESHRPYFSPISSRLSLHVESHIQGDMDLIKLLMVKTILLMLYYHVCKTIQQSTSTMVIGNSVAGLKYSPEVSKHGSVAIITKVEPQESNTNYAQGGVSAVISPSDSVESHMHDTMVAGAYLCDKETVRVVVCTEGPDRVKELIAIGASFNHRDDGELHLATEGGHSHHRIVHVADMTGRKIERALLKAVDEDANIFMFGHHFAIDLLTSQESMMETLMISRRSIFKTCLILCKAGAKQEDLERVPKEEEYLYVA